MHLIRPHEKNIPQGPAFWQMGFRVFFALCTSFASLSMFIWLLAFSTRLTLPNMGTLWHAHEMLFGFILAAVAGFLLTAVKNWTQIPTTTPLTLMILAILWCLARVLSGLGEAYLLVSTLFNISFLGYFFYLIAKPIIQQRQWRQAPILAKIFCMLILEGIYFLGRSDIWWDADRISVYAACLVILGLVLMIAQRVLPLFIENGLRNGFKCRNRVVIDRACLWIYGLFFISTLYFLVSGRSATPMTVTSALLALLHSIRIYGWYHKDLWKHPMVWILYTAYATSILGFTLLALHNLLQIPLSIPLHVFTVGTFSLMIAGMLTRVSLGHTGRMPNTPPKGLPLAFIGLLIALICRTIALLWIPTWYNLWILLAQMFWIISFTTIFMLFMPIWWHPRIDGQAG